MLTKQFLKLTTENIGNSFLFGATTKFITKTFKKGSNGFKMRVPDAYDLRSCLRAGGDLAKHALIYSLNFCVLEKIGLPGVVLHISTTFLTAFMLAFRNGVNYASKTATVSSITSFLKSLMMGK